MIHNIVEVIKESYADQKNYFHENTTVHWGKP